MEAREVVAKWIEERRQERDAPALGWVVGRAAFAFLGCFPEGQGSDVLWALVRRIAGREEGAPGGTLVPGTRNEA